MPSTSSGRGPTLARKRMFTDAAVTTIAAVIGRNASPDWIGVKPLVCCRKYVRNRNTAKIAMPEMPIAR